MDLSDVTVCGEPEPSGNEVCWTGVRASQALPDWLKWGLTYGGKCLPVRSGEEGVKALRLLGDDGPYDLLPGVAFISEEEVLASRTFFSYEKPKPVKRVGKKR